MCVSVNEAMSAKTLYAGCMHEPVLVVSLMSETTKLEHPSMLL